MGNLFSYHTLYQTIILFCVIEIFAPGSVSIFKELLRVLAGVAYSCFNRSKEGLTAAGIPIPDDLFDVVTGPAAARPELVIHDTSSSDRVCGYIVTRRQFAPSRFSLFGGPNHGPYLAGARQPGLKEASDAFAAKGHRRDPAGSVSKDLDTSRSDSLDDAASVISTATTTSSASTKATSGSNTSLPANAPKTSGLWAAARNAMPALSRPTAIKERYYCVLKGATVYLYDDHLKTDPVHVIAVDQYKVKVHNNLGEFSGRDGEIFNKKNAIVLQHHNQEDSGDEKGGIPMSRKSTPTSKKDVVDEEPWFLFLNNASDMEDWYLALLRQSCDKVTHEKTFSPMDMQYLVNTITNEVDPIASRWINSLIGVLYLRICETALAEQFIVNKITRKLQKLTAGNTFGFTDIAVREINLGTVPPSIHRPMLKDIQASGHTAIDFHLLYDARNSTANGGTAFRITLAAVATLGLGIQLPIVAAVIVKYVEGDMTVKLKPAPSNRIWYGFTSEPQLEFEVSIQSIFKFGDTNVLIDKAKQFAKRAFAEFIVAPNMDDLPFFDTTPDETRGVPEGYPRGGIFDGASKLLASRLNRQEVTIKPGQGVSQQPGISIDTSNIQPDTSLGKHIKERLSPTKRDKSPPKSKNQGISSKDQGISSTTPPKKRSPIRSSIPLPSLGSKKKEKIDDLTIHKNATEPVLSTEPLLLTDPDDSDTRGRTEHSRAAAPQARMQSPDAISIKTLAGESTNRFGTTEAAPVRSQTIHGAGSSITQSFASPTSRTTGILSSFKRPLSSASSDSREQDPSILTRSSSPSDTIHTPTDQASVLDRDNSIRSATAAGDANSSASVIDLLKARDRTALEARGAVAKTRFAKWGTESLARGKAEYQRFKGEQAKSANANATAHPHPHSSAIPVPTHQSPTSQPHMSGTSPNAHLARSPGKSLQERLRETARAAEAANAATTGHHPDGRVRSASNTSNLSSSSAARPALLSSPSKGEPSISEPDLTSATHHSMDPSMGRRQSSGTASASTTPPVLSQPAAGRSMVVPRIAKRSGEVTGLGGGKSPEKPTVLDKSNAVSAYSAESRDTLSANTAPPPLPPRDPSTLNADQGPSKMSSPRRSPKKGIPPALPPRSNPSSAVDTTKSNSFIGLSNLDQGEVDMERSKSHPGQSTPSPPKSIVSPLGARSSSFSLSKNKRSEKSISEMSALEQSLPLQDMLYDPEREGSEDAVMIANKDNKTSPSRAQHALRMVSARTSPTKGQNGGGSGDSELGSQVRAPV